VSITYDGDSVAIGAVNVSNMSLISGLRVMAIQVPPAGNFIIGPGADPDPWHPFVFQNGWHNSVAAEVPCQYRRLSALPNCIQIVGEMASGTTANDTVVTNLPVGYRPLTTITYPVACNPSPAVGVVGPLMQLKINGNLVIWGATSGTTYYATILPIDT
jgi:hypothetical protein